MRAYHSSVVDASIDAGTAVSSGYESRLDDHLELSDDRVLPHVVLEDHRLAHGRISPDVGDRLSDVAEIQPLVSHRA